MEFARGETHHAANKGPDIFMSVEVHSVQLVASQPDVVDVEDLDAEYTSTLPRGFLNQRNRLCDEVLGITEERDRAFAFVLFD